MQTWWSWVFQPRAPSVKILNVVLQSGQIASLCLSAWGGAVTGAVFRGFWNVDTADSVEDDKALPAISFDKSNNIVYRFGEDVFRPQYLSSDVCICQAVQ